jgi:hypothetical protein
MAKRPRIALGDDEASVISAGDTKHWCLMNDAETEALAAGRVTPSMRERARSLLAYRKDQERDEIA